MEGKAQKASKDTQKTNKQEQKNRIPQESPPGSTRVHRVLGLGANIQTQSKGLRKTKGLNTIRGNEAQVQIIMGIKGKQKVKRHNGSI